MTVTITAVPSVSAEVVPAPADRAAIERPLSDVMAEVQQSPAAAAARLANPAALASEVVGGLRGFFERAQILERAPRTRQRQEADNAGVYAALTPEPAQTDLHGGPAREPLEPLDAETQVSAPTAVSLAQLQRAMDLALASMNFATETTLVVRGTSQISHSANTLLKGQ
jgi:hypothetical protein